VRKRQHHTAGAAVTIKTIAKAVGVSAATVSRALNDSPLISLETRQRIHAVAQELGYSKNAVASGLSQGKLSVIGLIISDITNPFNAEVVRGVEDVAQRHGYGVILCNAGENYEKEAFYADLLSQHRVAGVIVTSAMMQDPVVAQLHQKLPVLLLSRIVKDADISYVACDDVAGGKMATEHLIELGHKRIGFVGGPRDTASCWSRFLGYRQALKDHKLPYRKAWVYFGSFKRRSGYRLAHHILHLQDRPSALFAVSDFIAFGILEAAYEAGFNVPDDLAVVGYDDVPLGDFPKIRLTTVSQSIRAMGKMAAEALFKVINDPKLAPIQRITSPELIVRGSCGATVGVRKNAAGV